MDTRSAAVVLLALMVAVAGCMPAGPAVVGERPAGEQPGRSVPTKSLTIAVAGEPTHFLFDFGSTGFGSVGTADLAQAVHRGLASYDDRGILHPVLATEVPSRERGTWIVRPDGTMQTTYRLRPHVTWHDGTPLTARAFALGWELVNDRELPISATGSVRGLLDHLEVRDDHTLVLEWGRTYPFAHALTLSAFPAVPPHLVEATYRAEPTRVPDLAYWTREFVGLGPYQLGAWEPGSHIVLRAYDGYFAGRARIDTIDVRFMPHQPTIVANLLAGTVDGVINRALEFEQAMLVKEEWERAGRRPLVINQPTHWRMIPFQFRDPRPREVLDVRVRRALVHAIDRQAVIDAILAGQSPIAHTFITPDDPRWEWVQDVVARYDYDPRRSLALLAEVGWRPGPDGSIMHANGERVELVLETSPALQRTATITAPYFRSLGLAIEEHVLSPADARDARRVVQFPAIQVSNIPLSWEHNLARLHGPRCPSEANRWTGFNSGCYQNPQHDAIIDALYGEIDPARQRQLWRDMVRLQSEDVPVVPMFFLVVATIFREGVTGVKGDTNPRSGATWNVEQWDVPAARS